MHKMRKMVNNSECTRFSAKTHIGMNPLTFDTMRKALCMLIMVKPSLNSPRKRAAHRKTPLSKNEIMNQWSGLVEWKHHAAATQNSNSSTTTLAKDLPGLCFLLRASGFRKEIVEHDVLHFLTALIKQSSGTRHRR
jgi:hypothetical protein